ncbi:unnamed protein product [Protopolystoma xenopodis]|uniref:Uncharacterized protein n=1 Tax=Protopolystoma xenopodis TaxID=117903 RepID=A0A448WRZ3_9PLAT|nr:unnamed protein product [Protopolystoma xenopodis]
MPLFSLLLGPTLTTHLVTLISYRSHQLSPTVWALGLQFTPPPCQLICPPFQNVNTRLRDGACKPAVPSSSTPREIDNLALATAHHQTSVTNYDMAWSNADKLSSVLPSITLGKEVSVAC